MAEVISEIKAVKRSDIIKASEIYRFDKMLMVSTAPKYKVIRRVTNQKVIVEIPDGTCYAIFDKHGFWVLDDIDGKDPEKRARRINITEYLRTLDDMQSTGCLSQEEIMEAEKTLGLEFSFEYREILAFFGAIRTGGHEIAGLAKNNTLNVVNLTRSARQSDQIPDEMYVIEKTGMDNSLILQKRSGEVYVCRKNTIEQLADSIQEYLKTGKE